MADNLELNAGSGGATLAADDISGTYHQRVKIQYGTDGSATDVSDSNPLPIDDAGGSLTVDNAALSVTGGGVESSALRVTLANDSTGVLSVDDNGGSLTVDGTVTANLSATDNAVLDNIDTQTSAIQTAVELIDDAIIADDAAFTPATTKVLMAGFEFDDTTPDSVDEGDAGAARMSANRNVYTQIRDAAGNERGVNVNASNQLEVNIGAQSADLTIADGGNSITVDGTVTANLSATDNAVLDTIASAVHSEDAAHNTGDAGVQALAVRNDSDASLAGTTGDYTPLQVDDNGYLKVNIKAGAGSGGTASTDDAAFTAASGSGTPMMGFATSDTVDSGDVGVLAMDTSRNLKVSIEADNAGIGGGTQYTEDAAAAANPVGNMSIAVRADSLGAVTSTDGDNIALRATNNGELYVKQTDSVPVTDNGGSLTVDNSTLSVTGGGTEASAMRVTLANDSTGVLSVDDNGGSLTVDGTVTANLSATDNAVLDQIELNTSYGDNTGGGTEAGALRVTVASDSTGVLSVDDNGGSLTVDNSDLTTIAGAVSGTEMQVDVVGSLPAGTNAIGKLAANSGVDIGDVDVTSISAGSNLIGDVGLSGARTSGGTTLYKNIDVDESEDQVKGTAGQVYWIHAINLGTSVNYLKLYNATAASVSVGTTVPDLTFPIPTQGDANGAGFTLSIPSGIAFGTAITIAATTGVADNDSGAPGANEVIVNLGYA